MITQNDNKTILNGFNKRKLPKAYSTRSVSEHSTIIQTLLITDTKTGKIT